MISGFLIFFCSHPVDSQHPDVFFWKNDHLVEQKEGFGRQIAVIEGEDVIVQCYVRSDADDYKIDWAFKDFHAKSSSTFRDGDGNEYAVSNLTVHINNPDDIDGKKVTCLKKNGDWIDLQFKVFVDDSVNCGKEINLNRWKNRTTEDALLQSLIKRLKEKLNCDNDEVTIGICGCKKKDEKENKNTKVMDPESIQTFAENDPALTTLQMRDNNTEENESGLIALITLLTSFGILVVIFTISYNVSQKARDYTQTQWKSLKNYLGVETVIARLQSACSNYCNCKKYRPAEPRDITRDIKLSFETETLQNRDNNTEENVCGLIALTED